MPGSSPLDRLRKAGIIYSAAAENIAYGTSDAQQILDLRRVPSLSSSAD